VPQEPIPQHPEWGEQAFQTIFGPDDGFEGDGHPLVTPLAAARID
jgi:hypothetical protein